MGIRQAACHEPSSNSPRLRRPARETLPRSFHVGPPHPEAGPGSGRLGSGRVALLPRPTQASGNSSVAFNHHHPAKPPENS